MSSFSRALRRWEMTRVATFVLAVAWLALLAAYGYAAISVTPSLQSAVAAAAVAVIGGAGILYAWREPGR
ncbi:MAG TPA: hypothetical protein VJN39_06500 [Gemmatimonadales bacterium]|nr:hypothetical protein [Gemmatimonadales bacterium]